jgi:transposase
LKSWFRNADSTPDLIKLKDWAFAIAKRSTMRKARVALARRLAIMHAMLRDGTEFASA